MRRVPSAGDPFKPRYRPEEVERNVQLFPVQFVVHYATESARLRVSVSDAERRTDPLVRTSMIGETYDYRRCESYD